MGFCEQSLSARQRVETSCKVGPSQHLAGCDSNTWITELKNWLEKYIHYVLPCCLVILLLYQPTSSVPWGMWLSPGWFIYGQFRKKGAAQELRHPVWSWQQCPCLDLSLRQEAASHVHALGCSQSLFSPTGVWIRSWAWCPRVLSKVVLPIFVHCSFLD